MLSVRQWLLFLVIILWAFIGLQFLLFYFIYLFIRHRSNPRKGQKPWYWERLAQSRPWHGLEEAAPVAELSCACSSSLFHRTCTGRIEKTSKLLPGCPQCSRECFIPLLFRTRRSPKTGTRRCSNRYTKYLVRPFHPFHCRSSCRPVSVQALCVSVFVCVSVSVRMCVCVYSCYVTLCSVSPSLHSEPIEENPYRPTYTFPENYDTQVKPRGTRRRKSLISLWPY